jgi:hypothetical protein
MKRFTRYESYISRGFRHALPLFTSLLNTVCGYIPGGLLPYNHLIWADSKERLVEVALQVNIAQNVSLQNFPVNKNMLLNIVLRS